MATDYSGQRGYRLFQPFSFTPEIGEFLRAQDALVHRLCVNRCRLIEVGCGKAEHGTWAIRRNLQYLGIDPSRPYLNAAERKLQRVGRGQFELALAGINDLPSLLRDASGPQMKTSLVLVPFNCLGNILQIEEAVAALAKVPVTHVISVFHDSPHTTETRRRYYANAGFKAHSYRTRRGICFSSGQALRTLGFNIRALRALWLRAGLRPRIIPLGSVGVAVVSTPPP